VRDRIFVIPHTHYDAAVFQTRARYLEIGLAHIVYALRALGDDPRYRFVLDQTCYICPFVERYPEQEPVLREMIAQGRLQITCGMYTMADVNIPSGESFIRQVLYGKRYCRDRLGIEVTCGWALDTFGHHPQMPQLLRKAGFGSYWFSRGMPALPGPSEFQWEGIDGSRVLCVWLPYNYSLFFGSPTNLPQFAQWVRERYQVIKPFAATSNLVGLAGADVTPPEPHLPVMVEAFNCTGQAPFDLYVATPDEYLATLCAATGQGQDLPVVKGDFNPVFQGCYSSRIEVKQRNRELERLLTTVEKCQAIGACLGLDVNPGLTERAWEPVLFNQFHDLICGVQADDVYTDTMRGYDHAERLALDLLDELLVAIGSRVDTRGEGVALLVFNTLAQWRSDVAEAEVSFSNPGVWSLGLVDADGRPVPMQVTEAERYADGGLKRTHVLFVARDVPPLGYALYRVVPNGDPAPPVGWPTCSSGSGERTNWPGLSVPRQAENRGFIANGHCRLEFDLWTGALLSLRAGREGWEVIRDALGNVVARECDGGDFWELNGELRGLISTASDRDQPPPAPGEAHLSSTQVGDGVTRHGPAMAEFCIGHPFGAGWYESRVRVYAGLERIDFQTQILNDDEWVRYRVLFPTTIQAGTITHEIPFGAIERPAREYPAQNWVDYGNCQRGVALVNRGLPGNNVADGVMMLSLLRATQFINRGGWLAVPSSSGQERGKRFTFDYALLPHDGNWQQAHVYRVGFEFNNPLIVRKVAPQPGALPARWGLLELSEANAVVSAVKTSRDGGVIVRVYEAEGRPAPRVRMRLTSPLLAAEEANLLEDGESQLTVEDNVLCFDLDPFEIKTFKLRLGECEAMREFERLARTSGESGRQ
jgi:alpha-mannosidase